MNNPSLVSLIMTDFMVTKLLIANIIGRHMYENLGIGRADSFPNDSRHRRSRVTCLAHGIYLGCHSLIAFEGKSLEEGE